MTVLAPKCWLVQRSKNHNQNRKKVGGEGWCPTESTAAKSSTNLTFLQCSSFEENLSYKQITLENNVTPSGSVITYIIVLLAGDGKTVIPCKFYMAKWFHVNSTRPNDFMADFHIQKTRQLSKSQLIPCLKISESIWFSVVRERSGA